MSEGWRTFMQVAVSVEHRRVAARWTRELVRLADETWRDDPSADATHTVLWTRLQDAKVRAVVEGDDMDDVVADLASRIEEYRIVDGVAAVGLDVDLARLRAQIAQECGDGHAALAHFADCVRVMSAHPELNLGSRLLGAVNLITFASGAPLAKTQPFEREVATAARTMLDDLPGVLGLGGPGVSALAALTERRVGELAGLDPEQVRLVATTVRARQAGDRSVPDRPGSRPTTRLGPLERSLSETLEVCAHHDEQGRTEEAVITLLEWLLVNNGRPIHDGRARSRQCIVAVALDEYVHASEVFSGPVKMTARYAAGESARHAGVRDIARQRLSLAYEEARSSPKPPIPADAIECDYAVLMIESAADTGNRADALRWLRLLFHNPVARSPLGAIHLAQAVMVVVREFGPDDIADEAAIAIRALRDAAAVENYPHPDIALMVPAWQAELLIATGDTASLPALLPVLAGLVRVAPPAYEAAIRQIRVGALVALGDVDGVRAELDRLAFLQDEEIGATTQFDNLPYADHFGAAQLMAAAAAADAQDVESAVDVLEQGRLRLLRRLRAGIEAADTSSGVAVDPEPADFWGVLAAAAEDEAAAGFGVAIEDWKHVFQDIGVDRVVAAADRSGVVAYQFVHAARLRMIYLVHGRSAFMVGPLDVADLDLFGEDSQDLLLTLGKSWGSAIATCVSRGFPPENLSPILIPAGERSELAVLNDLAFGVAAQIELGEPRLLNHLPSVRFAEPREKEVAAPAGPVRLLHVGDASNTLLGPWLEAAGLREVAGLDVLSLLGADSTEATFRRHLLDVSVIVASCHGAHSQGGLLGSSLMVGAEGLSVLDIATKHSLAHIDMLFLASCEMGRRLDEHHERESVSFSNAALVSGCRHVVAPILPVNDLLSAVVVDEFCRRLPADGSVLAFQKALAAVRAMTRTDLADRVHALWERLRESPLAERMPWPVSSAARVLERSVARVFVPGARMPTFCISSSGA
jgi:hypothetical protein